MRTSLRDNGFSIDRTRATCSLRSSRESCNQKSISSSAFRVNMGLASLSIAYLMS